MLIFFKHIQSIFALIFFIFFINCRENIFTNSIEQIKVYHAAENQELVEILNQEIQPSMTIRHKYPRLGFSSEPIWLEIVLGHSLFGEHFLELSNPKIEKVSFYYPNSELKDWVIKTMKREEGLQERVIHSKDYIFSFTIPEESRSIWLKIESETEINLPIQIYKAAESFGIYKTGDITLSWCLGFNTLIVLISFLLYLIYKEKSYLSFFLFSIIINIYNIEHSGFILEYVNFQSFLSDRLEFLILGLSGTLGLYFSLSFFPVQEKFRKLFFLPLLYLIVPLFLFSLFFSYSSSYIFWHTIVLIQFAFCLYIGLANMNKKNIVAIPFSLGWAFAIVSLSASFIWDLGLFESWYFLENLYFYLSSFFLFSFILSFAAQAKIMIQKRKEAEVKLLFFESERVEQERKVLEMEKLSFESSMKNTFAKNEFIKQIVFSIRQPLVSLTGMTEILLDDPDLSTHEDVIRDLKSMLQHSRILMNSLNDLSDFSMIESQDIVLNKLIFDMNTMVHVTILSVTPYFGKKNITIVNHLQETLPLIEADEIRLQQIMFNIFLRIVQTCKEGDIHLNADIVPGYIKFKIKYEGNLIEIPKESDTNLLDWMAKVREEAFMRYLNMLVTIKLIQLHGGRLYGRDDGRESFLTLFLPIAKNQNKHVVQKVIHRKSWSEYNINQNQVTNKFSFLTDSINRVLVIDDEVINLDTIKSYLESYNFIPILAQSGSEGLSIIHMEKPDLVLVDLFMPQMDGLRFCELLREIYDKNELPVILMTSHFKSENLIQTVDHANDYINRPFSRERLIARIKNVLNLSKMNMAYKRFVPPEFINLLNKKDISELRLGDQIQKRMTVLFSDLRSYTSLSENMSPEESFQFLNDYLKRVGPMIRKHGGFIDKYMGDAIMAIFPSNPDEAVRSAIDIQKAIQELNRDRAANDLPPLVAGIGIHTGNVMLGTIGEEKRMEGTVVSDAVNLSSRLENLTKLYQASILITMDTFLDLDDQDDYNYRILDRVKVKGKQQFVTVVEIMDGYEEDRLGKMLISKIYFEEGVTHYLSKDFTGALERFAKVIEIIPDDKATQIYIQRAIHYKEHNVPINWDGVENIEEKFY